MADSKAAPKFDIKKWNAVALWSWDLQVDTCAICRNSLMELCLECQGNTGSTSDGPPPPH